uniref:Uncharacterized protein n=1 Tax=Neobodo designis TaxID=312471 RepID=A0A7S1M038_NEODS|mmetsp:Transcript_31597/g.97637  ORF Transcript_31597/g.97637 Transcript_31597/m.97637 type:complete len:113 (+) Transcript_31597:56-394(+)
MRVCALLIISAIALGAWDPVLAHESDSATSARDSAKKAVKHAGDAARQWAKDVKGEASTAADDGRDSVDEAIGHGKEEFKKARDKGRKTVADAADDVAGAAEKLRDKADKEL